MEVYKAISAIIGEMSQEGIGKNSQNKQQGFKFRGIDAVYNALAPKLANHKLMILPRVLSREVTEKQTQRGGTLFYVVCECEFDFVSAEDGSKHTVKVFGEAMDSGDKATNKAMSIALKYAAFQTFFIPTEATTQDPDAEVHQVVPTQQKPAQLKSQQPQFDGQDFLTRWTHIAQSCQALSALDQQKAKVLTPAWKQLNKQQQAAAKEVYDACKEDLETKGA